MSELKTNALGFLFALSTDIDIRTTWPDVQRWDMFFDTSDPQTQGIIDALNFVGFIGSGQIEASEKQNLQGWQVIVESQKAAIIASFTANDPLDLSDYEVEFARYPQYLAVLMAVLVFNKSVREVFVADPEQFMAQYDPFQLQIPGGDNVEQRQNAQDSLIGFAKVVVTGDSALIEQYMDENLFDAMTRELLKEQPDIW
jgi:hypothetical protein